MPRNTQPFSRWPSLITSIRPKDLSQKAGIRFVQRVSFAVVVSDVLNKVTKEFSMPVCNSGDEWGNIFTLMEKMYKNKHPVDMEDMIYLFCRFFLSFNHRILTSYYSLMDTLFSHNSDQANSREDPKVQPELLHFLSYLDVSKNKGTPKWMVYNGKPY